MGIKEMTRALVQFTFFNENLALSGLGKDINYTTSFAIRPHG